MAYNLPDRRAVLALGDLDRRAVLALGDLDRRSVLALGAIIPACWPTEAAADNVVLVPAHQLIEGLLRVMKARGAAPFSQRYDMLAPVIDETFDLTAILRASVGSASWQGLAADQQQALAAAFRRYTVSSYVNSFDEFAGQRFVVNPETRIVGDEQVVQTTIIPVSGDSHDLDYVMHETPAGWRIVDVLADGSISRVAVQRSDFRQVIRQGGASALTVSLKTKSEGLWN
jgi:phospholipid transport system substrate-binding protein